MAKIFKIKQFIGNQWIEYALNESEFSKLNLENGSEDGSLEQKDFKYTGESVVFSDGTKGTQNGDIVPGAVASGKGAVAFGGMRYDYYTSPETHAENILIDPESTENHGRMPTSAEGNQSFAAGGSVHAYGDWSVAFGKDTNAYGRCAYAEGGGTKAGLTLEEYLEKNPDKTEEDYKQKYYFAHAEGQGSAATGATSHAEGYFTKAIGGSGSHAEGANTVAQGTSSHVEGASSKALANGSHAEGYFTQASGGGAHTEGYYTKASGIGSHSEGHSSKASANHAHAEGSQTNATSLIMDSYGSLTEEEAEDKNVGAHAEGVNTIAAASGAHVEGYSTKAWGKYAHAEGQTGRASGTASHTEGSNCTASGKYAHAEGDGTTASGDVSHAEGGSTIAAGKYAHAEGYRSTKIGATGDYSHTEGNNTEATNTAAHAEGEATVASGECSHAEGAGCQATEKTAHAEGESSYAKARAAHAEGYNTTASGLYSHSEGFGTKAKGHQSHAGGNKSVANSQYSFAHGNNVTADALNQAVFGAYNKKDTNAAFIVANGTSTEAKNIFTIKKDGQVKSSRSTLETDDGKTFVTKDYAESLLQGAGGSGEISAEQELNNYLQQAEIEDRVLIVDLGISDQICEIYNLVGATYVDWGDGTIEKIDGATSITHKFKEDDGIYTIKIYDVTETTGMVFPAYVGMTMAEPNMYKLHIPKTLTKIGQGFLDLPRVSKFMDTLIIPNTVTEIGAYFDASPSNSVVIGGGLKVLEESIVADFSGNKIILEEGITTIKTNAFAGVYNIKNLVFPSSITTLENGCLGSSYELKEIEFKGAVPTLSEGFTFTNDDLEHLPKLERIIVPREYYNEYKIALSNYSTIIESYAFVSDSTGGGGSTGGSDNAGWQTSSFSQTMESRITIDSTRAAGTYIITGYLIAFPIDGSDAWHIPVNATVNVALDTYNMPIQETIFTYPVYALSGGLIGYATVSVEPVGGISIRWYRSNNSSYYEFENITGLIKQQKID